MTRILSDLDEKVAVRVPIGCRFPRSEDKKLRALR